MGRQITPILNSIFNSQLFMVLRATVILLLGDLLLRLVFYAYNSGGGWDFEGKDLPLALLVGLRFDLATLAIFNGLLLILMILPLRIVHRKLRLLNVLLLLFHLPVLILNGIDVIYFGFASKRLSHELFTGGKDLANFSVGDLLPYWWLVALVLLVSGLQLWILNRSARKMQLWEGGWTARIGKWILPLLVAGMLFVAFRGGVQGRPLRPAMAFVTGSLFLGNVSLNSAYTVVSSLEIGNEPDVNLMPMPEAVSLTRTLVRNDFDGPFASEDYPLWRQASFNEPEKRYNVVILIVESLNAAKIGCIKGLPLSQSLTPNLDTLARHGRLYTNFYSNGSRSVQSLPAIFNSTPDIFARPMIGSSFETNQHWGIGNMLLDRGYHTSFVCGGPNGTMGFDSYSKMSGFKHYFGRNQYPGDQSIASNWGLHDAAMLQWLADMQEGFPKPFLTSWFSISNHYPFALPPDCPAEIKAADLSPMDRTVRYTDWALGQYFQRVRNTTWAANTVFMITGDHCFYFEKDPDRGDVQDFHVPLILLAPGLNPAVDDREGSHISIMPTLIDLLKLKTYYAGVGVSMLSQQNHPYSITSVMGILALSRQHEYLSSNLEDAMNYYRYAEGKWERNNDLKTAPQALSLHQNLKAIYQVCSYIRKYNKQNSLRE